MNGVRIVAEPTRGVSITDPETGEEVPGVESLTISMKADDLVRVDMKLVGTSVDVQGVRRFLVAHPKTGELKPVKRIEFDDEEWVA